ncbi:hypothetical protein PhCBS80983_g00879 [Powellomyces hirtus]|uniref:G-protein coupled receptors family 2 profile 2 domain-containing protein n=1 Tax=Powellomyces hirtus TaxID=109895 RepID=A0A507EFC7_9FUNG|nr:hypothetical protein PhCBS80983_g00879 [Powellomyces hirtus]
MAANVPGAGLLTECPPPFITDFTNQLDGGGSCVNIAADLRCCLPCPKVDFFYPAGQQDKLMTMYQVFFAISFLCAVFICITYVVLPGRRRYQGFLILMNNIGLALYTGSSLVALPDAKAVQCAADGITGATYENTRCAVQGMVFTAGVQLCLFAAVAVVVNLHMNVVWRSTIMERHQYVVYTAVLAVAAVLTALTAHYRAIEAMPGFLCTIAIDHADNIFFYPQMVGVFGMLLLHVATGIWMVVVSRRTRRESKRWALQQLRMQWRPAAFTMMTQVTWFSFWLCYKLNHIKIEGMSAATPWVKEWFKCVITAGTLGGLKGTGPTEICEPIAQDHVPNMFLVAVGLSIGILVGVFNSLVLISPQIIGEWKEFLGLQPPKDNTNGNSFPSRSRMMKSDTGSVLSEWNHGTSKSIRNSAFSLANEIAPAALPAGRQQYNDDSDSHLTTMDPWLSPAPLPLRPPGQPPSTPTPPLLLQPIISSTSPLPGDPWPPAPRSANSGTSNTDLQYPLPARTRSISFSRPEGW